MKAGETGSWQVSEHCIVCGCGFSTEWARSFVKLHRPLIRRCAVVQSDGETETQIRFPGRWPSTFAWRRAFFQHGSFRPFGGRFEVLSSEILGVVVGVLRELQQLQYVGGNFSLLLRLKAEFRLIAIVRRSLSPQNLKKPTSPKSIQAREAARRLPSQVEGAQISTGAVRPAPRMRVARRLVQRADV